jgi:hypothetical protein
MAQVRLIHLIAPKFAPTIRVANELVKEFPKTTHIAFEKIIGQKALVAEDETRTLVQNVLKNGGFLPTDLITRWLYEAIEVEENLRAHEKSETEKSDTKSDTKSDAELKLPMWDVIITTGFFQRAKEVEAAVSYGLLEKNSLSAIFAASRKVCKKGFVLDEKMFQTCMEDFEANIDSVREALKRTDTIVNEIQVKHAVGANLKEQVKQYVIFQLLRDAPKTLSVSPESELKNNHDSKRERLAQMRATPVNA